MLTQLTKFNESTVGNALLFNAFWFSACVGRDAFLPLTAALLLVLLLCVKQRHTTLLLASRTAVIGLLADATLSHSEIYQFTGGDLLPIWLILLWVGFASIITRSLRFLNRNLALAALFGAFGGPSSYFAGHRFGGVEFGYPLVPTLIVVGLVWACLLPLFFFLARQLFNDMQAN